MRTRTLPFLVAAALAAALVLPAAPAAHALSILSHERSVSAFTELTEGGVPASDAEELVAADAAPFAPYAMATVLGSAGDIAGADGTQDSQLSASGDTLLVEAGGSGLGFIGTETLAVSDSGYAEGTSHFELTFQVDVESTWSLAGFLAADLEYLDLVLPGADGSVQSEAAFRLSDGSGGILYENVVSDSSADFFPEEDDVLAGGLLQPGTYTLLATATGRALGSGGTAASGLGTYAMGFDVAPVPEPGAGALLAAGLLAAAAWRGGQGRAPR